MEQVKYQLDYPVHLGRKTDLNKEGFKPGGSQVAILQMENGREYPLFDKENRVPLTLEDDSYDLVSWREGLKSKAQLTIEDFALINQIELTVKNRLLEMSESKENLSIETLYFADEYPKDQIGKKVELNRKGREATQVVGYYINLPNCTALYSFKESKPLCVQTAKKQELKSWREGVIAGQMDIGQEEVDSLIEQIDERLSLLNNPKEAKENKKAKEKDSKAKAERDVKKEYENLKKAFQAKPDDFCILSVVGTGVLEYDEVMQLVLLNMDGAVLYQQSFMPISERLRKESYPTPIGLTKWSNEINKLKPIFESKNLIVFNPDYELKMIEQTNCKCEIESPIAQFTKALPMVKQLTGFSSLEGASKQHYLKVNQSDLTWNARLSAYMLLSILNPEADIFKSCQDLNSI